MNKRTILSLEQALSLSYATQRFVHLGWRVIRIEATPDGDRLPGDPNRYVGKPTDQPDRHAYFVGPNAGKESISVNLKEPAGQAILRRLIHELPVDVFACNTLPKHYEALGIDYATLSRDAPGLIWAGLSAMGPAYPDTPGYDPAIQALAGYMDVTGAADGPPTLCGVPFVDLKAGDEVYAAVCLALANKAETGKGGRIDVSMVQAAVSWLITMIPLLDLGYRPEDVRRNGSEHREFVPVNAYATADGFIYLAIGSDGQWRRLVSLELFASLDSGTRNTNAGRRRERESIHREIGAIARALKTATLVDLLGGQGLVVAPIQTVAQAIEHAPIRDALLKTQSPSGPTVRLPPPSVEHESMKQCGRRLAYAPRYGQDTDAVLGEIGLSHEEIADLRAAKTIA
ncbi:MAG: CaiB/BaiF CoA transferase family protein [Phycisphaerae bacterium]